LIQHPIIWRNNLCQYGTISRLFHWIMAALVLLMLCLGWSIDLVPKSWKMDVIDVHKSIGITVLLLVIMRLAWRFYNYPPPLPDYFPPWQNRASTYVHYLFYLLLFILPLTGWTTSVALGKPVVFFGLFQLPWTMTKDRALGKSLEAIHGDLAYFLALLILLHIVAALIHTFMGRSLRIWPLIIKK